MKSTCMKCIPGLRSAEIQSWGLKYLLKEIVFHLISVTKIKTVANSETKFPNNFPLYWQGR